jgi:hypothetical protein
MGSGYWWQMHLLGEDSEVLQQHSDLGWQIRECLEQIDRLTRQRRWLLWFPGGSQHGQISWQRRQRSAMNCRDQEKLVACDPFDACITRMRLNRELLQGQPAAEGFGVNGK